MAKNVKAVDFARCVSVISFTPKKNQIEVAKTHYSETNEVLSDSLVVIPLNTNTFETAMQIASAIASNVGLVDYEG